MHIGYRVRIETIYSWYCTFCGIKMFDICVYTPAGTNMAFFVVVVVVCRWNWSVKSADKSSLWFLSVLVFVSPVGRHSLLYISVGTTACAINGIV